MKNFVAYYRVSTHHQKHSGLGLKAQHAAVKQFVAQTDGKVIQHFEEVESGKHNRRPQLLAAMEYCELTGAVLLIAKLDRLSRNVAFLANLMESGVNFIACDNPSANDLTIHILAAVAEEERKAISLRTKAALQQAKERGVTLGNPKLEQARLSRSEGFLHRANRARQNNAKKRAEKVCKAISNAKTEGYVSLNQIAWFLNEKTHIKTARGSHWTATAVSRVLKYCA